MISVQLRKAFGTPAHWVEIGPLSILFSYETAVAFRSHGGSETVAVRKENQWGPTTGKHINGAGTKDYDVVPDGMFDRMLDVALKQAVLEAK